MQIHLPSFFWNASCGARHENAAFWTATAGFRTSVYEPWAASGGAAARPKARRSRTGLNARMFMSEVYSLSEAESQNPATYGSRRAAASTASKRSRSIEVPSQCPERNA